jgi:hypothetical protein
MKIICRLCLVLWLVFLVVAAFAQKDKEITTAELEEHIYFLASDSLKGRKPGTPESKVAATYIRDQFEEFGLKPLGEDGFQYFDVIMSVEPGAYNRFAYNGTNYRMNEDYKPMPFSSNGKLEAEVVFAGFGFEIQHDSLNWDSYAGVDISGKWVMILRGDPEPDNDESLFISYGNDRDKVLTARDKKAEGVLLVNGPQFGAEDKLVESGINRVTADAGLPVINITANFADKILSPSNYKIAALEDSIIKAGKPFAFATGQQVSAKTYMERVTATTQNIICLLKGNDRVLRDEIIVVGAHYDHLGFGGPGSGSRMPDTMAIHNGADDNASGTAGIIELAEKLAANKKKFRRSVLFMAFGAEEMGLLGSQFFVANPNIDLKQVKAMVNFDMIGRMKADKRAVMVAGTGTAIEVEDMLLEMEKESDIAFNHSPEGYGASDHASFYASGVPVLFFSTGAHPDYHTPFDDAEKINYAGEKDILDYAYGVILELANRDNSLTYKEAGPKKQARYGRGLKVKLGIMPDFTSNENNGLGVGGVTAGGPASKAGMEKGDRIVAIEGQPISNIYDYMNRLKKLKPGQTISVDIIRGDEPAVLVVVL